jgi:hypothetical protein
VQIAAEDYKSKADERGDRAAELREKKFMEEQVIPCCRAARAVHPTTQPFKSPSTPEGHPCACGCWWC